MKSTRFEEVTAPAVWTDVLENVYAAIRSAETDAAARESALAQTTAGVRPGPEEQTGWQECFGRLAGRLERWQEEVQTAQRRVWEIDAHLQAGEIRRGSRMMGMNDKETVRKGDRTLARASKASAARTI